MGCGDPHAVYESSTESCAGILHEEWSSNFPLCAQSRPQASQGTVSVLEKNNTSVTIMG